MEGVNNVQGNFVIIQNFIIHLHLKNIVLQLTRSPTSG